MQLSDSNLAKIRKRPQSSNLFLSIFKPNPIWKGRVNNISAAKGDRVIAYDGVTLGSYTDIPADALLLVGSTDGARDLGVVRVRFATASTLTVAENSDVLWSDNAYLTVLKFFRVDAKYPRIISDPNDQENVIFLKDWDVTYTTQNSELGSFPNAGSHRAFFRDPASGIAQTYWTASGTLNLLGNSNSYGWTFEGGSPSSSGANTPGLVNYSAPGHYVTTLVVSGTNGAVDTTYRYVSVYDYPGYGTGTPPLRWELTSLEGSRDEGGYTANIILRENVEINGGDVVVIFTEDWYGGEKVSIGSPILFVGYVLDDSIKTDYRNSSVEFEAGSISALMKSAEGFSISVESKAAPSTWFELLDMDIRRACYHYLKWHSTVLLSNDFEFIGADQKIQFFDSDRGSLYDAVDTLVRGALLGEIVSDRQGKLWAEVQASMTPNATGTYPPVMELSKNDWMGEPTLDENLSGKLSFVELGGIAYSGSTTGTFAALLSNAPGSAPAYRGSMEKIEGFALYDQNQLNQLSGNYYAKKNARYPSIEVELAGNYRNIDIAPQEALMVDLTENDTIKGVRIHAPYLATRLQWNFNSEKLILYPRATLDAITSGVPGETITIPATPDDGGGFNVPGLQIPPLPPLAYPFTPGSSATGSSCCDYFADLGLGAGTYCCTVVKRGPKTTPAYTGATLAPGDNRIINSFDYISNYQMCAINSDRILFLNTGTVQAYDLTIEADYSDNSLGASAGQLICACIDAGTFGNTGFYITADAQLGQSGHAYKTQRFIANTDFKAPNFVLTWMVTLASPNTISCTWANIKVTVCRVYY